MTTKPYVFYQVSQKRFDRCVVCMETQAIAYRDSFKHRNFCIDCASNISVAKLSIDEWLLLNGKMPNIKRLLPPIESRREQQKTFLVDCVRLNKSQYDVLQILEEPNMQFKENYLQICGKKLNKSVALIAYYVRSLQSLGFIIPGKEERITTLKDYIREQVKLSDEPRGVFIKRIAIKIGCHSDTISRYVRQYERENSEIVSQKTLADKIIDFLKDASRFVSIASLKAEFTLYGNSIVQLTIVVLQSKQLIEQRKIQGRYHVKLKEKN